MAGLDRWNRIPAQFGLQFRLRLPHVGFHRKIGNFAGHFISLEGEVLSEEAWKKQEYRWLPSPQDHAFVQSLMSGRVVELGKFADCSAGARN